MRIKTVKSTKILLLLGLAGLASGCGVDAKSAHYGNYHRLELRYYAYAPPFIPHKVVNRQCLDCHENGLVVDGFKAPVTPHPQLLNCQQCHIRPEESVALFKRNTFVGVQEREELQLPQPAGPPLIPHRLFMREKCLVCHGDVTRKEVVQTTHPERLNCLQCHVPQNAEVALFRKNTAMADPF
ncbi:MAG: multiheme c-type cytochrome [bacterium]